MMPRHFAAALLFPPVVMQWGYFRRFSPEPAAEPAHTGNARKRLKLACVGRFYWTYNYTRTDSGGDTAQFQTFSALPPSGVSGCGVYCPTVCPSRLPAPEGGWGVVQNLWWVPPTPPASLSALRKSRMETKKIVFRKKETALSPTALLNENFSAK